MGKTLLQLRKKIPLFQVRSFPQSPVELPPLQAMKPREYDFGRHRKIGSFLHKGINPNNRWSTPSHKLRSKEKAYEFLPCSTTNSKEQERERPTLGEGRTKMGAMTKRGFSKWGRRRKRGTGCDVTRNRHRTRHDETSQDTSRKTRHDDASRRHVTLSD